MRETVYFFTHFNQELGGVFLKREQALLPLVLFFRKEQHHLAIMASEAKLENSPNFILCPRAFFEKSEGVASTAEYC